MGECDGSILKCVALWLMVIAVVWGGIELGSMYFGASDVIEVVK